VDVHDAPTLPPGCALWLPRPATTPQPTVTDGIGGANMRHAISAVRCGCGVRLRRRDRRADQVDLARSPGSAAFRAVLLRARRAGSLA